MCHIDFQKAIDYLQNSLPAEEADSLSQHLPICTTCQQELETAQQFLAALQNGTPQNLTAPSPSLLNRVTAAFRHKQARLSERIAQEASLQFDSWSQLSALGVRGVPQERQLLFHEAEFDLDLQVMNNHETETYTMRGQLLGSFADEMPDELEGISLTLKNKTTGQIRSGLTDNYGRFSFSLVEQSDYELFVELQERDIVINLESLSITG